jgi:hypothetical protein
MFILFPPLSRLFVFVVADLRIASFWCHPDRSTSAFCWCGVEGSWLDPQTNAIKVNVTSEASF